MPVSYAVIGASRGIGLEYVRQLAARPDALVFAVVRNKAGCFHLHNAIANLKLKNVHVVEADIVDHRAMERAAKEVAAVSGGKLDVLIHNAAKITGETIFFGLNDFPNMDALDADFLEAFKVNALGVVHSVAAFLPLLRAGTTKKIIVIGADGAVPSTVYNASIGAMAAHGTTKAAGALIAAKWAVELKSEGFVVLTISPGLVDTTDTVGEHGDPVTKAILKKLDETTPFKLETPEEGVRRQLKVIDNLKPSDNGAFVSGAPA